MQNQNKIIHELDDSYKGRKEVKEMIERMMNTTEDGRPESNKDNSHSKTTA